MSLVLNGDTGVQGNSGAFVAGTAVASTSGTSIDFTSIPSWVKRITIMFSGVSTNGSSNIQVQIGAGSVETSGYSSSAGYSTAYSTLTTGFLCVTAAGAADTRYGQLILSLVGSNAWVSSSAISVGVPITGAGGKTLSGTLDRVRITTVNGTDTFDAGSINILYE